VTIIPVFVSVFIKRSSVRNYPVEEKPDGEREALLTSLPRFTGGSRGSAVPSACSRDARRAGGSARRAGHRHGPRKPCAWWQRGWQGLGDVVACRDRGVPDRGARGSRGDHSRGAHGGGGGESRLCRR
jgi:hypothetical protein